MSADFANSMNVARGNCRTVTAIAVSVVLTLRRADIFPEQWLPFLRIPPELLESSKARHGELLGPHWWRNLQAACISC